jgi:hypothetical protein
MPAPFLLESDDSHGVPKLSSLCLSVLTDVPEDLGDHHLALHDTNEHNYLKLPFLYFNQIVDKILFLFSEIIPSMMLLEDQMVSFNYFGFTLLVKNIFV